MRAGSIGEVRRNGLAFTAEVRGLSHYLQQPSGRLYQYTCDADVGDARCRVDLTASVHRGSGAVLAIQTPRDLTVNGLVAFASDWFTRGLLVFSSGANNGRSFEVKRHAVSSSGLVLIELWQEPAHAVTIGDAFTVTAGCDKQHATCIAKFSNAVNFRGFPHMPGNDFLTAVARSGRLPSRAGG
jgi:uncharacterized phage protein (TIGR02218 family)